MSLHLMKSKTQWNLQQYQGFEWLHVNDELCFYTHACTLPSTSPQSQLIFLPNYTEEITPRWFWSTPTKHNPYLTNLIIVMTSHMTVLSLCLAAEGSWFGLEPSSFTCPSPLNSHLCPGKWQLKSQPEQPLLYKGLRKV